MIRSNPTLIPLRATDLKLLEQERDARRLALINAAAMGRDGDPSDANASARASASARTARAGGTGTGTGASSTRSGTGAGVTGPRVGAAIGAGVSRGTGAGVGAGGAAEGYRTGQTESRGDRGDQRDRSRADPDSARTVTAADQAVEERRRRRGQMSAAERIGL